MPPDEASKIEDIAWEQDWIHMSRHFRVASPKKITVWREAENCNYLRNAIWCGGERGNFIEATKRKRKTKSPNWGKVNKSSNKFACDTFMDHVPGYFGRNDCQFHTPGEGCHRLYANCGGCQRLRVANLYSCGSKWNFAICDIIMKDKLESYRQGC